jgi:hypothetical protein
VNLESAVNIAALHHLMLKLIYWFTGGNKFHIDAMFQVFMFCLYLEAASSGLEVVCCFIHFLFLFREFVRCDIEINPQNT